MGRFGQTAHLFDFVTCLAKELETTEDAGKWQASLYALYRSLENQPGRRNEAYRCLDEAAERDPTASELAWEQWRVSGRRGPAERLAAVDRLLPLLEDPVDQGIAHLLRSQLLKDLRLDQEGALRELARAEKIRGDTLETVLVGILLGEEGNDSLPLLPSLRRIESAFNDKVVKAALLVEIADMVWSEGADRASVAELLKQVLSFRGIDWSTLQAARYLCGKIEDWPLYDKVLSRMAESAVDTNWDEDPTLPPGHSFKGFEPTLEAAAAFFWFQSLLREQKLGQVDSALESMFRAVELVPSSDLLRVELVRLLERTGRTSEALDVMPQVMDDAERCVLALTAKRVDLASTFGLSARKALPSLLAEILAEKIGDELPPPEETADREAQISWIETYPGHPDAGRITRALRERNVLFPLSDVMAEEGASREESILSIADKATGEPWSQALQALLGESYARGDHFMRWADSTADLSLRATLTLMAARAVESADGPRNTVENLISHADSLSRESIEPEMAFEPKTDNWRKEADALVALITEASDVEVIREALYKRAMILDRALGDAAAAEKALNDLIAINQKDSIAIWLAIRLAVKGGDWRTAEERLVRLAPLLAGDSRFIDLFFAELLLLRRHDAAGALRYLQSALEHDDEHAFARFYLFLAHSLSGDSSAVERAFDKEILEEVDRRDMEEDDFLFSAFPPDGHIRMPDLVDAARKLDGTARGTVSKAVSNLFNGLSHLSADTAIFETLADDFGRLADHAAHAQLEAAITTTSALLKGKGHIPSGDLHSRADCSLDTLWLRADRLSDDAISVREAFRFREGAELSAEADEDGWVEWMLLRAEAEEESGDIEKALATVGECFEVAPEHPGLMETEARLAKMAGKWEMASETHSRLARFYDSPEEKVYHLSQAAFILFDKLDNPRGALRICREAIRRASGYAQANDTILYILDACGEDVMDGISSENRQSGYPDDEGVNLEWVRDLANEARERNDEPLALHLEDVASVLTGGGSRPPTFCPVFYLDMTAEELRRLTEHPREACAAADAAGLIGDISFAAVDRVSSIPEIEEEMNLSEYEWIERWCNHWGKLLGLRSMTVHQLEASPLGIAAFVPDDDALLVSSEIAFPLGPSDRFQLARYLFRLKQGLGAFAEGDLEGPVRWMRTLTAVLRGEGVESMDLTEIEIVERTIEAFSPVLSVQLDEHFDEIVRKDDVSLRDWAQAASYSADRFGLLAAGSLIYVVPVLVAESPLEIGMEDMSRNPLKVINEIPRLKELLKFAISDDYLSVITKGEIRLPMSGARE